MQYAATIPGDGDIAVSERAQILALWCLCSHTTTDGYVIQKQEIISAMKKKKTEQRDKVMVGHYFRETGHRRPL